MSDQLESSGLDLHASTLNVGGDIVGRDKIVSVGRDYKVYNVTTQAGGNTQIDIVDRAPQVVRKTDRPLPPRRPRGFIGRTAELAQLAQQIEAREAVTLYAVEGAGKSTLLKQAANGSAAGTLPDGVALLEGIDVDGTALGPDDIIQRLFDKFFMTDPPLAVNIDSAQPHLSQLQPLILIDHVQLPSALIDRLPDVVPNGAIVISATQPPVTDATLPLKVPALQRAEAIQLLALRSSLAVTDDNRDLHDALCAQLGDVPLAIVIAGNALREGPLTLQEAFAWLSASPAVTATDPVVAGIERARQIVRHVLTADERQILDAVATLPGVSHDPDRLRALLTPRWSTPVIDEALSRLLRLGLLHTNSPRIRVAPGWRSTPPPEGVSLPDQLLRQLQADAAAGRLASDQFCHDELGSILGAIELAAAQQRWPDAIVLSRAISPHLSNFGLWQAWERTLQVTLTAARAAHDQFNEAWALHQLGTRQITLDTGTAAAYFKSALDMRQAIGDAAGAAISQHNLNVLLPPAAPLKRQPKPIEPPPPTAAGLGGLVKVLIVIAVLAGAALLSGLVFVGPQPCDRVVVSGRADLARMTDQIERAKQLRSGESMPLAFSEPMLDAYVREFAARSGDLAEAGARLIAPGQVLVCGRAVQAGNVEIAAKVGLRVQADQPYELEGLALRVIDTGGGVGWVAVPTALADQLGLTQQLRQALGQSYRFTAIEAAGETWRLQVEGR